MQVASWQGSSGFNASNELARASGTGFDVLVGQLTHTRALSHCITASHDVDRQEGTQLKEPWKDLHNGAKRFRRILH